MLSRLALGLVVAVSSVSVVWAAAEGAAKQNHQLVKAGKAEQVACPLTGKPVNPAHSVDVQGVSVGLCCPGCKGKVSKATGDAQVELVFAPKPFEKGFKAKN